MEKEILYLGCILLGSGVLRDEVDTDTGLVHGGGAAGVIKWWSVTSTRQSWTLNTSAVSSSITRRARGEGRLQWRPGIMEVRRFVVFRLWFWRNLQRATVKSASSEIGRRGSTIANIVSTGNIIIYQTISTLKLVISGLNSSALHCTGCLWWEEN